MSRNTIIVQMYHLHKLLDFIYLELPSFLILQYAALIKVVCAYVMKI
jgi:hypothetical protein